MQPTRWLALLSGLALAVGIPAAPAHADPPPDAADRPAAAAGSSARITLITGDRVRVTTPPGKPEAVSFEPGPDSRSDSAVITRTGGHTFVIPSAAAADVSSGRLDRTLFDVTTLLAEHRDDARTATMPVIIRYAGDGAASLGRARQAKVPGATKTKVLTSLGARAASVRKTSTKEFWSSLTAGPAARVAGTVERVSLDRRVKVSVDQSVPQIGAPAAWQRGLTGKGVKVAVLDTGLDPTHPDLAGRIGGSANFSEATDAVDHNGHGTHVASTVAGNGSASGGKYKGVAPEATLLNGKVLDDDGSGSYSGIIAGMEWATSQGAAVVNLSLGSDEPSDGNDELSQAVNRLSEGTGTLFVVAAGNCYDLKPGSIGSPAAADAAVAVGNLLRDGSLNDTSCRGPRKGDGALKPELSAPGTDIVAAKAAGTELGEPVGDSYVTLTGTSMATPHVAGTAALIAQQHPTWRADQLKARLISTADPQQGSRVDEQGAGRVDADQSTGTSPADSVTVDAGELELGVLRWPYPASDPVSRELTYRNPSGTAVTLQLAASVEPAQATPKLSASQLVVPAGGEAKVTVTADRAAAGPGNFSGRITATAAGADPVVTTIGWYAEPELYNLTIKGIARDGGPASSDLSISRLDGDPVDLGMFGVPLRNGTATVRLPRGKYEVSSIFFAGATDQRRERMDVVTSAETNLTKDATATLDARKAKPVRLAVSGTGGLAVREASMDYLRKSTEGRTTGGVGITVTGAPRDFGATPAKAVTGTSEFSSGARLEVPPYRARTLGADGGAFPVLDFYFGPRFTGTKDLQVFDAGSGSPAGLAGVRGKLALIRYSIDGPYNGQVVKAAEDAGAAAALLYAPDQPGLGGVSPYWAQGEDGDATIPAARTSRAAAQQLLDGLKSRPVTVRLVGQAATPVVYDLLVPWQNRIPADARVTAGRHELARVDETFGSHTAGMTTSETRHGLTPGGSQNGGWLLPTFSAPAERTSYILANEAQWMSLLILDNGGANMSLMSPVRGYRPGERSSVRWVAPVHNSGVSVGAGGVSLGDGALLVSLSPFMHGPDQGFSPYDAGEFTTTVHRDGVEIASAPDNGVWVEVPPEAADYRISLDARRENPFWRYSTRVQSTWTFRSKGVPQEVMPLVLADLDVPQADALNQVRVGQATRITLGLRHQAGSSTAKFATAELELSYDGQSWTKLPLRSTGAGKYVATVTYPVTEAGKAPSLRLKATDADGNKLTQEVTRAYGLVTR